MYTRVTIYIESVEPLSTSQSSKGRMDKSITSNQNNRYQEAFLSKILPTGQLIDLLLCLDELGLKTANMQEYAFASIGQE